MAVKTSMTRNGTMTKLQIRSLETSLRILQRSINYINQIKQTHSLLITSGHLFITNKWINTLLYNTLIRAHLNFSKPETILTLFIHMLHHNASPNSHTFPSLIKAIVKFPKNGSRVGYSLNAQCVRRGLVNDPFVRTSFLALYAQTGDIRSACKVFDEIPQPCIVSYNAMIDSFARNGDMDSAVATLKEMRKRDVYTWTSVINGYLRNGGFKDAIECFKEMIVNGVVRPNEATYVTVLSSCSNLDVGFALNLGKQIHGYLLRSGVEFTVLIGTALVTFYGRMAYLSYAFKIFESMDVKQVCTWNAMICVLASNGKEKQGLEIFRKMTEFSLRPNEITFVGVLSACARIKLVDFGLKLFRSMSRDFGITPRMEHCGCVVDLLGRAGLLNEAFEFVKNMPFEADASVLGALLGACRVHGAIELGKSVGKRLIKLQPNHCGRYVLLSNIYAEADVWDRAASLRRDMVDAGIKKVPAFSIT